MSRTTITLIFNICLLLNELFSWADKLFTDINLNPIMPDEDKNFAGFLVFGF